MHGVVQVAVLRNTFEPLEAGAALHGLAVSRARLLDFRVPRPCFLDCGIDGLGDIWVPAAEVRVGDAAVRRQRDANLIGGDMADGVDRPRPREVAGLVLGRERRDQGRVGERVPCPVEPVAGHERIERAVGRPGNNVHVLGIRVVLVLGGYPTDAGLGDAHCLGKRRREVSAAEALPVLLACEIELARLVPADAEHNGGNRTVGLFELPAGRAELDGPVLVEERGRPGPLGAVADDPHPLGELGAPEIVDGGGFVGPLARGDVLDVVGDDGGTPARPGEVHTGVHNEAATTCHLKGAPSPPRASCRAA